MQSHTWQDAGSPEGAGAAEGGQACSQEATSSYSLISLPELGLRAAPSQPVAQPVGSQEVWGPRARLPAVVTLQTGHEWSDRAAWCLSKPVHPVMVQGRAQRPMATGQQAMGTRLSVQADAPPLLGLCRHVPLVTSMPALSTAWLCTTVHA